MENSTTVNRPLCYNNGNFPMKNYIINPVDNSWYKTGDEVYSMFKIGDDYYANAMKYSKSTMGFAMAFANDNTVPVKNGFLEDETVYWGVLRDGGMTELKLDSTYLGQCDINAIFAETDHVLDVKDNLYYSLNPEWPEITELKITTPLITKSMTFAQLIPYKKLTPKWTTGYFTPELSETKAVLKLSKNKQLQVYLNACSIRFSKADVAQGYFILKLKTDVLANSNSKDTERKYKIYW